MHLSASPAIFSSAKRAGIFCNGEQVQNLLRFHTTLLLPKEALLYNTNRETTAPASRASATFTRRLRGGK
jgi:hypothetical protein